MADVEQRRGSSSRSNKSEERSRRKSLGTNENIDPGVNENGNNIGQGKDFALDIRGQVVSAQLDSVSNAVCVYEIVWGPDWLHHHGSYTGETQMARNKFQSTSVPSVVWNFPVEVCFKSTNVYGWPRLVLTVRDGARRIVGYGSLHIPVHPGMHTRYCKLFTPKSGSGIQSFLAATSGEYPEVGDHPRRVRNPTKGRVSFLIPDSPLQMREEKLLEYILMGL